MAAKDTLSIDDAMERIREEAKPFVGMPEFDSYNASFRQLAKLGAYGVQKVEIPLTTDNKTDIDALRFEVTDLAKKAEENAPKIALSMADAQAEIEVRKKSSANDLDQTARWASIGALLAKLQKYGVLNIDIPLMADGQINVEALKIKLLEMEGEKENPKVIIGPATYASVQPQLTPGPGPEHDWLERNAKMSGALSLSHVGGMHIEPYSNMVNMYFPFDPQTRKPRCVSWDMANEKITTTKGITQEMAQAIIAIGAEKWGNIRLETEVSEMEKIHLFVAAHTHEMRKLAFDLEQGKPVDEARLEKILGGHPPQSVLFMDAYSPRGIYELQPQTSIGKQVQLVKNKPKEVDVIASSNDVMREIQQQNAEYLDRIRAARGLGPVQQNTATARLSASGPSVSPSSGPTTGPSTPPNAGPPTPAAQPATQPGSGLTPPPSRKSSKRNGFMNTIKSVYGHYISKKTNNQAAAQVIPTPQGNAAKAPQNQATKRASGPTI